MERSAGLPTFIRTVWVLYLVTILSYIIAGLPLVFQLNQQPCEGIGCLAWQLPADNLTRLEQYGIPLAQCGWNKHAGSSDCAFPRLDACHGFTV
jgi:hypothetical protein